MWVYMYQAICAIYRQHLFFSEGNTVGRHTSGNCRRMTVVVKENYAYSEENFYRLTSRERYLYEW